MEHDIVEKRSGLIKGAIGLAFLAMLNDAADDSYNDPIRRQACQAAMMDLDQRLAQSFSDATLWFEASGGHIAQFHPYQPKPEDESMLTLRFTRSVPVDLSYDPIPYDQDTARCRATYHVAKTADGFEVVAP